jgi:biopolymer transport protein ExbD
MAFTPRPRPAPLGFYLTPMIDVVFQLLIFFVCANTWSHMESADELELPAPIRSAQDPTRDERPRVTINLRPDGTMIVSGKPVQAERLTALLQTASQQHGDRLEVLIRAHRQVPYAKTQEVIRACSRGGIREVRFAVLRERT